MNTSLFLIISYLDGVCRKMRLTDHPRPTSNVQNNTWVSHHHSTEREEKKKKEEEEQEKEKEM